jgi:hypothetical protein
MTDAAKYDHRRQTVADTYLRDEAILADLLQAVIMETAITSILKEIPRDESIVTIVRQTIADHAHDEKYHHAYFTDLFIALWTALPPPKRHQVGQSVPHLMIAVLGPRKEQVESILGSININSDKVSQIINDIYTDEYIASGVRSTAKATIRLLSRVGVFDDPVILDSFRRAMLI